MSSIVHVHKLKVQQRLFYLTAVWVTEMRQFVAVVVLTVVGGGVGGKMDGW